MSDFTARLDALLRLRVHEHARPHDRTEDAAEAERNVVAAPWVKSDD